MYFIKPLWYQLYSTSTVQENVAVFQWGKIYLYWRMIEARTDLRWVSETREDKRKLNEDKVDALSKPSKTLMNIPVDNASVFP